MLGFGAEDFGPLNAGLQVDFTVTGKQGRELQWGIKSEKVRERERFKVNI